MTWVLQAAVVLAVPLSLVGAVKAGALIYRKLREDRGASVAMGIDLQLTHQPGISEFKGWFGEWGGGFRDWLADRLDGTSSDGGSSGFGASSDGDGDASGPIDD